MPIRDFTDPSGTAWRVWSTQASSYGVNIESWLTFESATSRRRVAPIPAGWEQATSEELAALCARAIEVTTPVSGAVPPRTRQ